MPSKELVERRLSSVPTKSATVDTNFTASLTSEPRRGHDEQADQSSQAQEDFIDSRVPEEKRYSTLTMTLLWITMLTNFPMVIIGFEFYRMGFSLGQVLTGTITGSAILIAFQFFSGFIGARTGLNFSLLIEPLFGKYGVKLICSVWSLMFLGWYALNAVLMTDAVKGLFGLSIWTPLLTIPILAAMAINNWFGFRGVANFARYLAAPVLILWVIYAFTKVAAHTSLSLAFAHGTQTFSASLVVIPVLVIGNATWGNEADFFRYGKSSKMLTLVPLVASAIFGTLLFPTTGWLLGHVSGSTDTAAFTKFMNDYTFGTPWLAALALTIGYFALNDGNLYGAINALENIWKTRRHNAVLLLVVLGGFLATGLSYCPNALDTLASLNCVLLPCVTMIVICEFFVVRPFLQRIPNLQIYEEAAESKFVVTESRRTMCMLATVALIISWAVGIATSGAIPHLKFLNSGIWILYSWCSSFTLYGIFRALQIYYARYTFGHGRANNAANTAVTSIIYASNNAATVEP